MILEKIASTHLIPNQQYIFPSAEDTVLILKASQIDGIMVQNTPPNPYQVTGDEWKHQS